MANPIFESGLFFLMIGVAFFFTFVSFKTTKPVMAGLRLLAMALFCFLAIIIGSGDQIAQTSNQTINNPVTNDTWNETDENVVIPGGISSYWMAYMFTGFAIMNLIFIVKDFGLGVGGKE